MILFIKHSINWDSNDFSKKNKVLYIVSSLLSNTALLLVC